MKVSVCCNVKYWYDIEVDPSIDINDDSALLSYVDNNDPVYRTISNTLYNARLDYEGEIVSIDNDETGECLFAL